jgi:hypothetical protein
VGFAPKGQFQPLPSAIVLVLSEQLPGTTELPLPATASPSSRVIRGCLNGTTCGTFYTTFTFTGKLDPGTGMETHGRCHHPIVGGMGGFAGAKGVLDFIDDLTQTPTVYPYRGHITIH